MYTDDEIRMADAAIKCLVDGPKNRREVLHAMDGMKTEHYAMLRNLTDDLKLVSKGHDTFTLTFEGRKAAATGFRAWMEQRERKEREPQKMEPVERKFLRLSRNEWFQVAGWVIALLVSLVGLLSC